MNCIVASGVCALGVASAALGQAGFNLSVDYGPGHTFLTPINPVCRVRIEARFAPNDYAVAGVRLDLVAGEPGWVPGSNSALAPMNVGAHAGIIVGNAFTMIIGGQLNFPAAGIFADPGNPIGVWAADWTTDDFGPRQRVVSLTTRTARFDVYPLRTSPVSQSRMSGLTEGESGILVGVPAPSALAVLGLSGVAVGHRRRRQH